MNNATVSLLVFFSFLAQPAPAVPDTCADELHRLARAHARRAVPFWQPGARHRLGAELERRVRERLGDLAARSPDEIALALAKEIETHERATGDRVPPRALALFVGALVANGLLLPLALAQFPEEARNYAAYFIGGIGVTMLGALSGPVMKRLEAAIGRWAAARETGGARPDAAFRRELVGIAMRTSGAVGAVEEAALFQMNDADAVIQAKLFAAMWLAETTGRRDRAARLVASALKAYLRRYPGMTADEPTLAESWRVYLEFADQAFRDEVFNLTAADPVRANQVLDAWMPGTRWR